MDLSLSEEPRVIFEADRSLSNEYIAPSSIEWDQTRHFPANDIRKTDEFGIASIYVSEEHGGSGN
ncbi:MAG: acyl-CoA dehydrogenase family protein [Hyphomicrobiales bacterium]